MSGTMVLAPNPVLQFTDSNGALLVGGQLFTYEAGSTTKQAVFTDSIGATAFPNPIVLNDEGSPAPSARGRSTAVWLDPTLAYKFVLSPATDTDPPTNPFWTVDGIVSPQSAILAALAAYEAALGGTPIGGMMAYGGTTAPAGWLFCFGQALSRTTYALLFAVISTSFGAGDNSTTFNLPDLRGRVPVGKDDMGGSAASRVTNVVSGVQGATLGAAGGDEHAQADTPTASSTVVSTITDPGHRHVITTAILGGSTSSGEITGNSGAPGVSGATQTAVTGIGVSSSVTTTVTSALTGQSQNIQPSQVVQYIIFTAVSS